MSFSRRERFRLKSSISDEMSDSHLEWTWERKAMLLAEFNLGPFEGYNESPSFEDLIAGLNDVDLMEMYSIVTGVEMSEVENAVDSSGDSGNWQPGYVRLFISHSAKHKESVGEIAKELAVVGIHGFVAHDTMAYSKPWQAQIEQALRSMQAFVALVHEEFNASAWCHQEVGWAFGRRVPKYVVRMGVDPAGFIGHDQWPSGYGVSTKEVAGLISSWASSVPDLGETMTDGLFAALESAGNYVDAGATADRIATLSGLTSEQWARLSEIYWKNDQLYTGVLPSQALKPFYLAQDQDWPPSKPTSPASQHDPWAAAAGGDEPPF